MKKENNGSLFYQFNCALSANFAEGTKKHSYKIETGRAQDSKIFSYSDYYQTVARAKEFAAFVRDKYPHIKNAYQITNTQVSEYLNSKLTTCCMRSLATYTSQLNHLARALEQSDPGVREHGGKSWNMPKPKYYKHDEKKRNVWMDDEDRSRLEACLEAKKETAGKRAIQIALATGLRAQECVSLTGNDIDVNAMVVRGRGKGGRHYESAIRAEYREIMTGFKKFKNKRIADIQADSANKYLHGCLRECGIDDKYTLHRTGIHSIRKNVAQSMYEQEIKSGKSHVEASTRVSYNLSHGRYRRDVDENYIKKK